MNINTKALKGVIEEVEASKLRQKAEAELQREAIKRAVKQHQLDGKAIRIVLQRRAMGEQKRDEQDYYVHAYEHALGGKKLAAEALENGATIREAAAIGGISTGAAAALAKGVQKTEKIEHDAETGEIIAPQPEDGDDGITESCGGVESRHAAAGAVRRHHECHSDTSTGAGVAPGPHDTITETGEADTSGADAGRPSEPSAPAEQSVNSDPPPGRVSADHYDGQGEQPGTHTSPGGPEVARAAPSASDDDLKPLPFLRGPSPANRRAV